MYRGAWRAGLRHGQGQFNDNNNAQYQGQWVQGLRNGSGRADYADGGVYEGNWANDKPHGFGRRFYADTATYEGSWENGERQGYGTALSVAQVQYEGIWRADQRHGFGREKRPDGSYFAGFWRQNKRHGQGREVHADGSVHEGLWQNDSISGPGRRASRVGITISGTWQGNTIVDGNQVASSLLDWLIDQARTKDPHAQYFLATAYMDFLRPPADPTTAKIWLRRAAAAGVAEAQYRLSILLIDEDVQASVAWLLATVRNEDIADPSRAIDLIRPLVLYLGNWQHLDTLAAAHARQGETEIAERMQAQALLQARTQAASEQMLSLMSARLELYRQDQAYIE